MNKNQWRTIGLSIPIITAIVTSGIFIKINENLWDTGITFVPIMVIAQVYLAWAIYYNYI